MSGNPYRLHLLNLAVGMFRLGHFPRALKKATVVTLSKAGRDTHSFKGWRPITLLPAHSKGLERLAAGRMTTAAFERLR
jgi:hypothetical protein